jgi:hypothetical protein
VGIITYLTVKDKRHKNFRGSMSIALKTQGKKFKREREREREISLVQRIEPERRMK